MTALLRPLFGRQARLRWVHLVLGGALAMPYVLVGTVVVGPVAGSTDGQVFTSLTMQLASFAVGLPLAVATSLFPLTRPLEGAAVRWLCGVPADRLAEGPARGRAAKGPYGAVVRAASDVRRGRRRHVAGAAAVRRRADRPAVRPGLAGPRLGLPEILGHGWGQALAPAAGVVSLLALAGCAAGAGALLARWAPALLGPSPRSGSPPPRPGPPISPCATAWRGNCTTRWGTR